MTEKLPYDFDLRLDDPVSTHAIQFRLVPGGSRVLDIGCHTGILGAALQIHKHCEVTGIDNDKTALAIASERLHETNLVNLEIPGWSKALGNSDRFDVLLFGDVIEHTREPQRIIEESLGLLKQGGIAIISLPNIANLRVRLNLLFGKFIYSDAGILDWSHLRFFTLKTARQLVTNAGLKIVSETYSGYSLPRWLIDIAPSLFAVNIIMVCRV